MTTPITNTDVSRSRDVSFSWPDEAVDTLQRLWVEGFSASQIAAELGHGLTRSAVLGKANRLGLGRLVNGNTLRAARDGARRARAGKKEQANPAKQGRSRTAKTDPFSEVPSGNDVTRIVGIMEIERHDCHWIEGDPKGSYTFCGKPVKQGTSWCPEHYARVFPGRPA